MAKDLTESVLGQIGATRKRPVLLYEIGLTNPLKFAAYMSNVTFPTGGDVYTAKAIMLSGLERTLEGQINRCTVRFDDVLSDMSAYADDEDFQGKTLIIKRVYLDALANATDYIEIFNGFMESPNDYDYAWLTVPATMGRPLNRRVIKFNYQRMCPWVFGGAECNTNGKADLTALTATGTAESGTVDTLIDSALTQAADFWNNGNIYITKSGVIYRRKVKDFDAATDKITLDVALDFAIDNKCTYEVFKGCDQTWDTCGASNAWGPSADNSVNFGGCIHLESQQNSVNSGAAPVMPGPGSLPPGTMPPGTTVPIVYPYPPGWYPSY